MASMVYEHLSCSNKTEEYDKTKYKFFKEAFYKYTDDGLGGAWVSGLVPATPCIIHKLEQLSSTAKQYKYNVDSNRFVVQSYILDKSHMALFYPYFDSAAMFEPGLNFYESFAPFFEVTPQNNPGKMTRWIRPYLDATGKGYVTTVSVPVYALGEFQANAGSDISINSLAERLLDPERIQMILTEEGIPIAATALCETILKMKTINKFYYLKEVVKDEYVSEELSLFKQSPDLARMAEELKASSSPLDLPVNNKTYTIYKSNITETNWTIISMYQR
jgi:hypothetical protein